MSAREFPDWYYSIPDSRTAHIRELEDALLEINDASARYAELLKLLTLQVEVLLEMERT